MLNFFKVVGIVILFMTSIQLNAQKHKFLEGKKYSTQFYELKASGRGKAVPSDVYFKGGKLYADLMEEKILYPPVNYKVTLDSTYTEDDEKVQLITAQAEYTEEKSLYKAEFTVTNYTISGTFVLLKNGVEKKKFEFDGEERKKK